MPDCLYLLVQNFAIMSKTNLPVRTRTRNCQKSDRE